MQDVKLLEGLTCHETEASEGLVTLECDDFTWKQRICYVLDIFSRFGLFPKKLASN